MNKGDLIGRDECMYLEGVEEATIHIGGLLNELMDEIIEYFNTAV